MGVSDGTEAIEQLLTVDGRDAGTLRGQSFDAQSLVTHDFFVKSWVQEAWEMSEP